jgi:hypothetical protein
VLERDCAPVPVGWQRHGDRRALLSQSASPRRAEQSPGPVLPAVTAPSAREGAAASYRQRVRDRPVPPEIALCLLRSRRAAQEPHNSCERVQRMGLRSDDGHCVAALRVLARPRTPAQQLQEAPRFHDGRFLRPSPSAKAPVGAHAGRRACACAFSLSRTPFCTLRSTRSSSRVEPCTPRPPQSPIPEPPSAPAHQLTPPRRGPLQHKLVVGQTIPALISTIAVRFGETPANVIHIARANGLAAPPKRPSFALPQPWPSPTQSSSSTSPWEVRQHASLTHSAYRLGLVLVPRSDCRALISALLLPLSAEMRSCRRAGSLTTC